MKVFVVLTLWKNNCLWKLFINTTSSEAFIWCLLEINVNLIARSLENKLYGKGIPNTGLNSF